MREIKRKRKKGEPLDREEKLLLKSVQTRNISIVTIVVSIANVAVMIVFRILCLR